jgi:ribosomal protein L37E
LQVRITGCHLVFVTMSKQGGGGAAGSACVSSPPVLGSSTDTHHTPCVRELGANKHHQQICGCSAVGYPSRHCVLCKRSKQ